MEPGSGSMAACFHAESMYGSGSITMQVDVQHAQKHRRPSSVSSGSLELSISSGSLLSNPSNWHVRYARAVASSASCPSQRPSGGRIVYSATYKDINELSEAGRRQSNIAVCTVMLEPP